MAFASTLRKNISKLKSEFKWEDGSVHSEAKHLWGRIDFRQFSGFITHRAHSIVSIVQESRCLIRKRRNYIPAGWLEPVCLYYHHRRLIYSLDELFVELFFSPHLGFCVWSVSNVFIETMWCNIPFNLERRMGRNFRDDGEEVNQILGFSRCFDWLGLEKMMPDET